MGDATREKRVDREGLLWHRGGLFQRMGVPTVILGPGDIAEAHRPNEFVALEQLAQCETFLGRILETGYPT